MKEEFPDSAIQVDRILKHILKYASGEYDYQGFISKRGDKIDAIIGALNILGEELNSYVTELEQTKAKAEESIRLKSAFLSNVSHEIRTPLSIIMGFVEILEHAELSQEEYSYFLNGISENASLLLKTITNIIDLSLIEHQPAPLDYSDIQIQDFLHEIIIDFKSQPSYQRKKHIPILFQANTDIPLSVSCDKNKLRRIIMELLDNAIKFSSKGEIKIRAYKEDKKLLILVEDSGVGISKDSVKNIFEKFRQAEESLSRHFEGIGLGLTIAKAFTEQMGGLINVESEPGEGSVFIVAIPDKPVHKQIDKKSQPVKREGETKFLKGKTILIVDDDKAAHWIIKNYLKQTDAETIHVQDGYNAIEQCRKNSGIKLVLMDVKLPKLDGLSATSEIKKLRPNLPVILHTAKDITSEELRECQCDGLIRKPTNKVSFLHTIFRQLASQAQD